MKTAPCLKKQPGFTLMEIMVSTVIIAIMFSFIFFSVSDFRWISNETSYHNALRLLKLNDRIIKTESFDSLPPDIKVIPSTGIVELSRKPIVPESVAIVLSDGKPVSPEDYRVDPDQGSISWLSDPPAGKKAVIKYSYIMPDSLETCRVSEGSPHIAQLSNYPVDNIYRVEVIDRNKRTLMDRESFKVDKIPGKLTFNADMAGRIIQVKYSGEKIRSVCTSKYLDPATLEESWNPTELKLIKITEIYGSGNNYLQTVQLRSNNAGTASRPR